MSNAINRNIVAGHEAKISKILVANRSEIAIRVFRAANELRLKTVAIWAEEDKYSLHRFKPGESYQVGRGPWLIRDMRPIESYLSIDEIMGWPGCRARMRYIPATDCFPKTRNSPRPATASLSRSLPGTDAPGGQQGRRPQSCHGGGRSDVPATNPVPDGEKENKRLAAGIGYPVMLKASWGGGHGMHAIRSEADLIREVTEGKREAKGAFGEDEVYLEKLIERARHVEVQILDDTHGNAGPGGCPTARPISTSAASTAGIPRPGRRRAAWRASISAPSARIGISGTLRISRKSPSATRKYAASRFAHEAAPALTRFANSSPMPFVNGIKVLGKGRGPHRR